MRDRLTYSNVMATIAVFVALGGTSYAAIKISGRNVEDRSLTGKDVKKNSLTGKEIKESRLGEVPRARFATSAGTAGSASTAGSSDSANTANTANSLAPGEAFHEVGAPGEPAFEHNCGNFGGSNRETVGFYKDHEGVVHLKGWVSCPGSDVAVFRLPEGYRPATGKTLSIVGATTGGDGQTTYNVNGSGIGSTVDGAVASGFATVFSLDGATFRAQS
jgi:hypothetical protein